MVALVAASLLEHRSISEAIRHRPYNGRRRHAGIGGAFPYVQTHQVKKQPLDGSRLGG
jgi:hypothetical protein